MSSTISKRLLNCINNMSFAIKIINSFINITKKKFSLSLERYKYKNRLTITMHLNKQQKLILYALGLTYQNFNEHLKNKPLDMCISKSAFIELALKSNITNIQERALYKNLEFLEKQKIILYKNKSLVLSKRGNRLFEQLNKEVAPFLKLSETFDSQNILKFTNKAKTILSTKIF